jgi:hypothetical protein
MEEDSSLWRRGVFEVEMKRSKKICGSHHFIKAHLLYLGRINFNNDLKL